MDLVIYKAKFGWRVILERPDRTSYDAFHFRALPMLEETGKLVEYQKAPDSWYINDKGLGYLLMNQDLYGLNVVWRVK